MCIVDLVFLIKIMIIKSLYEYVRINIKDNKL